MGANSKIQWCDHTFNPWMGCTKVSPGCVHCYAERDMDTRWHKVEWGAQGTRVKTSAAMWRQPVKWNKNTWRECHKCGFRDSQDKFTFSTTFDEGIWFCPVCHAMDPQVTRQRVFCASLADVFEDWPGLEEWRQDLFALIKATPNLDWLLLTKRPENVKDFVPSAWWPGQHGFPSNVWLGVSVENQKMADLRIPRLLDIPAQVRFLSCEPLLEEVDLGLYFTDGRIDEVRRSELIDWVICGGESGPEARPMSPGWATSLRSQCQAAYVPFFFKQWGEHAPVSQFPETARFAHQPVNVDGEMMVRVGKGAAGRLLDGREWNEVPHA